MLTSSQILQISEDEPERLFGKPDFVHDRYKALAKKWHPDNLETGNSEVFLHINLLHEAAKKRLEHGEWHIPGEFSFKVGAKEYVLRYFKSFDFELGKAYMSETKITYVFHQEFTDLAEHAKKMISAIPSILKTHPDKKTEEVMTQYLPVLKGYYETSNGIVLMIDKPSDLIRMRDLLEFSKGKIDPRHVAWMISRMFHHAAFFEWAKLVHNDMSLDTLFVCPEQHTICVLGGWWYTTELGKKPIALPSRTLNNVPSDFIMKKLAITGIDSELVRLTSRELLGNANGIHLIHDKDIPEQMTKWLRISGRGSAVDDYKRWREKIVTDAFGKRKFFKYDVTSKDVYAS